jgi:hypothetical protein
METSRYICLLRRKFKNYIGFQHGATKTGSVLAPSFYCVPGTPNSFSMPGMPWVTSPGRNIDYDVKQAVTIEPFQSLT